MNINAKKEFLNLYLLQQARITRLYHLMKVNRDAKERYIPQIESAKNIRERIEDAINAVDGGLLSEILSQKYLCGKTLEETAAILNYSKRQIERLYGAAMEKLVI